MGNGASEPVSELDLIYKEQGEDALTKKIWEDIIKNEDYAELKGADFDIECLAFEGGGVKGIAYIGALKVLEDLGVLSKIKRFAGTSAGAYMAMQLAIGMSVDATFKTNGIPSLESLFYDSSSWWMPYNILRGYGWHSGAKMLTRIQDDLEQVLGDRDATFLDLYKKRGVELCVVVTDLNGQNVEYCHPKTTPAVKIAEAVKTSMSLPFLFEPTIVKEKSLYRYFVDGGLLENYPVRVYDGWYLSMKPSDDFFQKIGEDPKTKFDGFNDKMLGMVVFSHEENQSNSSVYLKRYGEAVLDGRPDSKLSMERVHTRLWVTEDDKSRMHQSAVEVVKFMAQHLRDKADRDGTFSYAEFEEVVNKLRDDQQMSLHLEALVGPEGLRPLEKSFQDMDMDKDGRLSLAECLMYLQRKGVSIRYNLQSREPRKIESMSSFILSFTEVMLTYISQLQEKSEDRKRTIGIYTDYITLTDFDMSLDDKEYMIRQGYKAAINYLKDKKNN